MGLLDGQLDPQTMAQLQLAGGLLSPGSFGQGLQRGVTGYQGTLANSQDMQLKQQQILAAQQEQQMREIAMQQAQRKLQWLSAFGDSMNGQGGAAPTPSAASQALAVGANNGSVGPTNANAQLMDRLPPPQPQPTTGRFAGINPDNMALGIAAGAVSPELAKFWNEQNTGTAMQPGWRVIPGQKPQYMPDPTKSITLDGNGKVVPMDGALDTQAAITGATKSAEMRATNANTPVPLDRLDRGGVPGLSPTSSIDALLHPAPPPAPLPQVSGVPSSQMAAVLADNKRLGSPPFTVNGQPMGAAAPAPTGLSSGSFKSAADMAADAEKAKAEAVQPVNFGTKVMNEAHSSNQKNLDDLSDIVNNEGELVSRNNRITPLISQLTKSGGWAYDQRIQFANDLKNSGLPKSPELANWIASGDPGAAKTIQNQLSAAAIQTMLDTLNKEGKPNRVMYQALHEQQEGLANGKDVLSNIMALQKQLYDQHLGQLGTMTDLMSSPDYNPLKFKYQFATTKSQGIGSPGTASAASSPAVATLRWNPATGKLETK